MFNIVYSINLYLLYGRFLLCCLPALAEATYRYHYLSSCVVLRLASASVSQTISFTFFSGTTEASFLIFGPEHQYGELYRVTQFWICGMSTSSFTGFEYCGHRQICSQDNICHIFSGTTEACFLIFGTEHQYGDLYRITQFWICGMSTSCLTRRDSSCHTNYDRQNYCIANPSSYIF